MMSLTTALLVSVVTLGVALVCRVLYLSVSIVRRRRLRQALFANSTKPGSPATAGLANNDAPIPVQPVLPIFGTSGNAKSSVFGGQHLMVVLGSGGHTSEMMCLLKRVDRRSVSRITYVIADTDVTSRKRFEGYEAAVVAHQTTFPSPGAAAETVAATGSRKRGSFASSAASSAASSLASSRKGAEAPAGTVAACAVEFVSLPRSREVGQSYVTSVFTTLKALLFALTLVFEKRPSAIVVNGPGTCVPICWSGFLLRVLGSTSAPKLVFVESFARVQALSLTGKLLYPLADRFVVQWPQLVQKHSAAEYLGILC